MKKMILAVALFASLAMVSCSGNVEAPVTTLDSTKVDTVKVDTCPNIDPCVDSIIAPAKIDTTKK